MGLRSKDSRYVETLPFANDYFQDHPDQLIQEGIGEWVIERMMFGTKGVTLMSRSFTIFVFKSSPDYLILRKIVDSLVEESEVYFPLIFIFPNPKNIRYEWDYEVSTFDKNMGFWIKKGDNKYSFLYSEPFDEGVSEGSDPTSVVKSFLNKIIPEKKEPEPSLDEVLGLKKTKK